MNKYAYNNMHIIICRHQETKLYVAPIYVGERELKNGVAVAMNKGNGKIRTFRS
jgi:hypothetical protein